MTRYRHDPSWSRLRAAIPLIGIFDSGVGGLSIAAEIRRRTPSHDIVYIADRARAPWGVRPDDEILDMSLELTERLIGRGASMVVVACHAGSVVALEALRATHPQIAFVGLDPAIKPAASLGTGPVAVLTTAATLRSSAYQRLVTNHGNGAEIVGVACPRWVELVEQGVIAGPEAEEAVAEVVDPLLERDVSAFVLACTHFPVLTPVIEERIGPDPIVITPSIGVAKQVERLAGGGDEGGGLKVLSTGPNDGVVDTVVQLMFSPHAGGGPVSPPSGGSTGVAGEGGEPPPSAPTALPPPPPSLRSWGRRRPLS